MYVRAYVRVGHAYRNVNLQYRLEFALMLRNASLKRAFLEDVDEAGRTELGGRFSAMEGGEDSAAGPSQRTYLAESSPETSAERTRRLATLTKKKGKRSVHRRSQESKKRATKSSKEESTYWRVSTSQVLFFWLPRTKPAV